MLSFLGFDGNLGFNTKDLCSQGKISSYDKPNSLCPQTPLTVKAANTALASSHRNPHWEYDFQGSISKRNSPVKYILRESPLRPT